MISLFKDITPDNKSKLLKLLETSNFTYQKGVNIAYLFKDKESIGLVIDGSLDIVRIDYNGTRTIIETIYEDEIVKVFLDISPISNGHCLIVPKKHYTNIEDIDLETLKHINEISKKIKYINRLNQYEYTQTELKKLNPQLKSINKSLLKIEQI